MPKIDVDPTGDYDGEEGREHEHKEDSKRERVGGGADVTGSDGKEGGEEYIASKNDVVDGFKM
jgi:hypothetical protein